ncbi:hypothetical protein [Streptomyces sp. NBC_01304]|uniref:hypothetical protein n=1 Tax=Streptomyces sp. NBC_01304 TaxID=2903818 RepID=UPI002E0D228B|nr:hypothetical protein OG430_48480 [Streptomyces sp. NBC_01304]
MSKYRPPKLPTGVVKPTDPDSGIPAVRTREEVRQEWLEKSEKAQAEGTAAEASEETVDTAASSEIVESKSASDSASEDTSPARTGSGEVASESAGGEDDGLVTLPANRDDNGYVAIPEFTEPTSADPKERLDHYARGVAAVEYASRANNQATEQQRIISQGQFFLAIKEEFLWEAEGLPNFDALIQHRFKFGGDYANKTIRAMPVVLALGEVTTMELKEKHLRPLVPVWKRHGDDAVRKVWDDALRKGKITEKSLKDSAYFLGYGEPVAQKAKVVGGQRTSANGGSSVAPGRQSVDEFVTDIRELITRDKDEARRKVLALWKAAEELGRELGLEAEFEAAGAND